MQARPTCTTRSPARWASAPVSTLPEAPRLESGERRHPCMHRACDKALADLNRAIELDPGDALDIASRGETYRLMERYEEALADFPTAQALGLYRPR
jgi:hypothetical protein